jgi:hypothetical protein
VIRRHLVRAVIRASRRLHRAGDQAARSRGLQVRTGRYGLARQYRDPRWTGRSIDPS